MMTTAPEWRRPRLRDRNFAKRNYINDPKPIEDIRGLSKIDGRSGSTSLRAIEENRFA